MFTIYDSFQVSSSDILNMRKLFKLQDLQNYWKKICLLLLKLNKKSL